MIKLEGNDYETKVKQEIKGDGPTKTYSDTRMCSSNKMKNAATNLVCKKCAVENREKSIDSYANGFERYIKNHASAEIIRQQKNCSMLTEFRLRSLKKDKEIYF